MYMILRGLQMLACTVQMFFSGLQEGMPKNWAHTAVQTHRFLDKHKTRKKSYSTRAYAFTALHISVCGCDLYLKSLA